MAKREIAIDLGSSMTHIFLAGEGVVVSEPSVVAVSTNDKNKSVRKVGMEAFEISGHTSSGTSFVYPIKNGVVVDEDLCVVLLRELLKKLLNKKEILLPKYKVLLCVPMGSTLRERFMLENVCIKAGITSVTMVEGIIATAVGIDRPVEKPTGNLVVNLGGGKTEIAVISNAEIVAGSTLLMGGENIDKDIVDFVAKEYNANIGMMQAANIKMEIGSVYDNDISAILVKGTDIVSRNVCDVGLRADQLTEVIVPVVKEIIATIAKVIKSCNIETIESVYATGLYLCGGVSKLAGLDKLIESELGIGVKLVENPEYAQIVGAGKLVTNFELLQQIIAS